MGAAQRKIDFDFGVECLISQKGERIAKYAHQALLGELATHPKPGLVSHSSQGSHPDLVAMDFLVSAGALEPFFKAFVQAGFDAVSFQDLQKIGIEAEAAMLEATGGKNTHRGAIFCLGFLCAAAGRRLVTQGTQSLGTLAAASWGADIPSDEYAVSNGAQVCRRYHLGGIRKEARLGFPTVYRLGLESFRRAIAKLSRNAACVQTFFTLLAITEDTTLWHRGGAEGASFARERATAFLKTGGVYAKGWERLAETIHEQFIERNLTAGGSADLLAVTLFLHELEP